jgi:hypothetical protein
MSKRAIALGGAFATLAAAVAIGVVFAIGGGDEPLRVNAPAKGHKGMVTGTVWVANEGSASLTAIDAARNEVVTTLAGIEAPHNLQVSPDGKTIWAVSGHDALAVMVDGTTMHRSIRLVASNPAVVALVSAAPAAASGFGNDVATCAREHLGQRPDVLAVTCTHHGTEMTLPTFGAMVLHMKQHHGWEINRPTPRGALVLARA